MAQGIWQGGGGGTTSDDVTATRDKVVQGFTALTADSDDEPGEGTIPNRGVGSQDTTEFGVNSGKAFARFKQGYYSKDGTYDPWVWIPFELLESTLGVDPQKMLNSLTIAGRQGAIPEHPNGQDTWAIGWDGAISRLWARLPRRNGYYNNPSNDPWLYITKEQLISTLGLNPAYWLDSYNCMGMQGHIPRWVCTTGDVISAWNGEGHVWDDVYAGRGRGLIVRIPCWWRIENANWVFLSSPNLHAHNIRAGVNINGVTGTLVDYGAGGVAFNGATFDGRLLSKVASNILNGNAYAQVMRISNNPHQVSAPLFYPAHAYTGVMPHVPCTVDGAAYSLYRAMSVPFNNSVNLTPFSRVTMSGVFRGEAFNGLVQQGNYSIMCYLAAIPKDDVLTWKNNYNHQVSVPGAGKWSMTSTSNNFGDRPFDITMDVSGLNGHHMIVFTAIVMCAQSYHKILSTAIVNNITFHN